MLYLLLVLVIISPIIFVLGRAFYESKDYYKYDERKSRFVSYFRTNKKGM